MKPKVCYDCKQPWDKHEIKMLYGKLHWVCPVPTPMTTVTRTHS